MNVKTATTRVWWANNSGRMRMLGENPAALVRFAQEQAARKAEKSVVAAAEKIAQQAWESEAEYSMVLVWS